VARPGVGGETSMRYKGGGSAEMTVHQWCELSVSPLESMVWIRR